MSSMSDGRLWKMKALGLVVGCCAKFVTGSLFVFSVYQGAIKDTFNYTQTQVETLSSMMNIGLGLGFLPGIFYDHFGPKWCSSIGGAIAITAHLLIWSTTKSVNFYASHSWLMTLFFFMTGIGSVFLYMVALNTNGINFEKKHAGKVISLLNCMFAGSQAVFPLIYYHLFTNGDITDTRNQDFPGFFIMLIICYAVVGVLCVLFLRIVNPVDNDYTQLEESNYSPNTGNGEQDDRISKPTSDSSLNSDSKQKDDVSESTLTMLQILCNSDYQLIIWMFGFASCIGLVYVNNITVISRSVHLDHYNDRLTIIIPISSSVLSLIIGFLSDRFRNYIPRALILLVACILFCLSQILVAFSADSLFFLVLATLLVGLGLAFLWTITPTIMRENFHARNLGRNWGITIFVAALMSSGAQAVFGVLYDSQKDTQSDTDCFGLKCIRDGSIMLIVLSGISILFSIAILWKSRVVNP